MIRIKINDEIVGVYTEEAVQSMDNLIKAIKLHLVSDWHKLEVEDLAKIKKVKKTSVEIIKEVKNGNRTGIIEGVQ